MAVPVPNVNWDIPVVDVSKLYDSFQQGRKDRSQYDIEQNRKLALSSLPRRADGTVDYGEAAAGLLRAGDIEGGTAFARLADSQAVRDYSQQTDMRDFQFQQAQAQRAQSNADRTFGLQEQQINRRDIPSGYVATQNGLQPIPGGPRDPATIRAEAEARAAGKPARIGGAVSGKIPAEVGARIGLGDQFLKDLPAIRQDIDAQGLGGTWNWGASGRLAAGLGKEGEISRRIAAGADALVRELTGAGMAVAEAQKYADRYQIGALDNSATIQSKLEGLSRDLEATKQGAISAVTGQLATGGSAPQAQSIPEGTMRRVTNSQGEVRDARFVGGRWVLQ